MPADSALTRNSSCPATAIGSVRRRPDSRHRSKQAHTAAVSTATCCCMQHAFTCSAAPWNIMENIYGDGSYHRRPPRPGPKFLTCFFFPPCSSCRNNPHIYIIRPRQLLRSVVWVVCFIYLLLPKQSKAKRCKSREMDRGCCPSLCLPPLSSCLFPSFFFSIFLDSKEKKQKGNSTTTARGPGCLHCIA